MVRRDPSRHSGPKRTGKTLVLFALLLPLLLGMVGLAIDGGLLLAAYRQTQNAADTAALSAAYDLLNNLSAASAQTNGANYVQTNNNMAKATVTINVPPSSGPHAGSANFAEALVSYPYQTSFIQLLGVNTNQTIGARAVAGLEGSSTGAGITTLQQSTTSGGGNVGITVSGGSTVTVNGAIVDNATTASALNVSGTVSATSVSVSGGSNAGSGTITSYTTGAPLSPSTNTGVNYFDAFANLPVPTTSTGVNPNGGYYGVVAVSGDVSHTFSPGIYFNITVTNGATVTFNPGIYTFAAGGSITVTNGATVTFNPGIYVLAGGGLNVDNTSSVNGSGVMFYNTAKSYSAVPSAASPTPITRLNDEAAPGGLGALPNDRGVVNQYGSITINAGPGWNVNPSTNSGNTYSGILIFQDRSNTQPITVSGGTSTNPIGTIYAPNTLVNVSSGSFTQLIVGSLNVNGGTTTVNPQSQSPPAQANLVYLVE